MLKNKILDYYERLNVCFNSDEVFISDGAKSQLFSLLHLFEPCTALICTPCYPAYIDINKLYGNQIAYLKGDESNNFLPLPKDIDSNKINCNNMVIFLCSPNNPTGNTYSKADIRKWINFAIATHSVIIYDSAYQSFLSSDFVSPYQIEGAKSCVVEVFSYSKGCGFTGIRCGYTIVPFGMDMLNKNYSRFLSYTSNGVSYLSQMGAFATYGDTAKAEYQKNIDMYKHNVKNFHAFLDSKNIYHTNGNSSPYVFFKAPNNVSGDNYFNYLLTKKGILATMGSAFGSGYENYIRVSLLQDSHVVDTAIKRLIVQD